MTAVINVARQVGCQKQSCCLLASVTDDVCFNTCSVAKALGPSAFLYTNECSHPLLLWHAVPAELDAISVDIYAGK